MYIYKYGYIRISIDICVYTHTHTHVYLYLYIYCMYYISGVTGAANHGLYPRGQCLAHSSSCRLTRCRTGMYI